MPHDAADGGMAWRFSSAVTTHVVDDTLFVLTETGSRIFEGSSFTGVADLLDGIRSTEGIARRAGDEADAVKRVVHQLHRAGYLAAGARPADDAGTYIECLTAGRPPDRDVRTLTISILALDGAELAARVAERVRALGCQVCMLDGDLTAAPDADLLVVMVRDYLDPRVAHVNAGMLRRSRPWLVVKPFGREAWIGPRFVPDETGCWNCLAARVSDIRQVERFLAERSSTPFAARPSVGVLPGVDGMVAAMVAADILASLAGATPLTGALRTVSLADFETLHHPLTRLPHCPACGNPGNARRSPQAIAQAFAGAARDRPWRRRALSYQDVLARLADHVDPHLGVVSALKRADRGASTPGHTYLAAHVFPMVSRDVPALRRTIKMRSSGRGATPEQARAMALCEAMERYCGGWIAGTPAVRASWQQLDRRAVHPEEVLLFSASQYAERDSWNEQPVNALHRVPEVFDESRPVDFTPAWSLTHSEPVLVPAGLAWYGHPDLRTHAYAVTDSNGCAAGGSLPEATLYALCELYERDAVAIWWYNRIRRPQVDVAALDDPFVAGLMDTFRRVGRTAWVLDVTTDLAMPAYAAVSCDERTSAGVLLGFGADPDPRRAIARALSEMDQLLPLVCARGASGVPRYATRDPATVRWLGEVDCTREPWLLPQGSVSPRHHALRAELDRAALGDVIDHYVEDLRRAGIETIVVEQTRPDIDLAVARVICPAMRHFWRRTAPGRLYDVPVSLDWIADRMPEGNLNPYSVFI